MKLRLLIGVLAGLLVLTTAVYLQEPAPAELPVLMPTATSGVVAPLHTSPPGVPHDAVPREFNGIVYYIVPVK